MQAISISILYSEDQIMDIASDIEHLVNDMVNADISSEAELMGGADGASEQDDQQAAQIRVSLFY